MSSFWNSCSSSKPAWWHYKICEQHKLWFGPRYSLSGVQMQAFMSHSAVESVSLSSSIASARHGLCCIGSASGKKSTSTRAKDRWGLRRDESWHETFCTVLIWWKLVAISCFPATGVLFVLCTMLFAQCSKKLLSMQTCVTCPSNRYVTVVLAYDICIVEILV